MKSIRSGDNRRLQNQLTHVAIRTRDPSPCIKFYSTTFGLQLTEQFEDPAGRFSIYFLGGPPPEHTIEVVWNWDEQSIDPGRLLSHIAFTVSDLPAVVEHALKSGGKLLEAVHKKGEGHYRSYVEDPDGMAVELNYLGAQELVPPSNSVREGN